MSEPSTARRSDAESRQRYPTGPAVVPHRKNAAEWIMWCAIAPAAWVMQLLHIVSGMFRNAQAGGRRRERTP